MFGGIYKVHRKLLDMIPATTRRRLLHHRWVWQLRYMPAYLNLYVRRCQPIIVYQMGKVGSSSVYRSLLHEGMFALHCHSLNPDAIDHMIQHGRFAGQKHHWRWIHDAIVKAQRPAKFISLVRDPVAITVSNFFERSTERFLPGGQSMTFEEAQAGFDAIRDRFLTYLLNWFDNEVHRVLKIDVYDTPFDPMRGYASFQQGNFDLLVLKLETGDSLKTAALADFLDVPDFQLHSANVGKEKLYADFYQDFKQRVIIPDEVLGSVYQSKMMQHFYSEAERDAFAHQWTHNRSND